MDVGRDYNIVKIFSPEECPSKIGNKSEDDFQGKTLSTRPSTLEYDDFPPGFEGNHFQNQSKSEFSYIKWECPPPVMRSWKFLERYRIFIKFPFHERFFSLYQMV
ncbi:hypothetical protein V8G54_014056 [Vigna mungo]|uniref:Uncharacterized protein n=1 Tax=Vigna mungo TaxID=3915 RepID=A0AAQ3RYX5_VIGMU